MRGWFLTVLMCVSLGLPAITRAAETGTSASTQAKQLKMEGTQLQLTGKTAEAVKKYRESLALQPDEKLAALIGKLENQAGIAPPSTQEQADGPVPVSNSTEPPVPVQEPVAQEPPQKITTAVPVQAGTQPADLPEPVIPAAVIPPDVDDSYGQYRMVQKLSFSLQGAVIKGSETEVYINLGQVHGVPEGMQFEIVRPGAPIKAGDEIIGHEETKVAIVEAITVRDKFSICRVQKQERVPQVGDSVYQLRKKVQRLVVGQFTYGQGVNQFTKDLQEKLVTAFAAKGLQVVEREKLEKVLEEQQLGYSGLLNVDSAKKIGELLGAEGIILGTISDMGNDISLNGRLVDIGSGDTVSAAEVKLVKTSLIGQLLDTQIKNSPMPAGKPKAGGGHNKVGKSEVQEVEGFEFAINGCKRSGKTATCSFTIVNKQEDRYLSLWVKGSRRTIVVDNLGNSYIPNNIQLANCQGKEYCSMIIVDNLPTRASFVIDDVSSDATSAAKVVLYCADKLGHKHFSVSFRDVEFME